MTNSHNDREGRPLFEAETTEIELDGVSRRTFLNVAGASAALAGVGLSGCIRKPKTTIIPYAKRPEDLVEGVPLKFASAYQEGATVTGIIVESHEGRPTKIAGNKAHPESLGATSATTQASVLELYDLDRSVLPHGAPGADAQLSWEAAWRQFDTIAAEARDKATALVLPALMSPTVRRLVADAQKLMPKLRVFRSDLLWPAAAMAAAEAIGGPGAYTQTHLDKADVVAAFDADVLGTEPGWVRMTKGYAKKRKITGPNQSMSRIYAFEPTFSSTGATADHRARVKAGDIGRALAELARQLAPLGVVVPSQVSAALPQGGALPPKAQKLIGALAKDLAAARGRSVVVTGHRQPAWVHALGFAINAALGAYELEGPQSWHQDPTLPEVEDLGALAEALSQTAVETVFVIGANPAHAAPGALGLARLLAGARVVHAGSYNDETGRVAALHIPISHYLEAWGDLQSLGGVATVQQPLIEPLHHTPSGLEVLGRLIRQTSVSGHELVKETWGLDPITWERWLHDGVRPVELDTPASTDWSKAAELIRAGGQAATAATEVVFGLDPNLLDGRHANNGWLRELPHPMSKLTWDNAALMNKKTAGDLKNGDLIRVTVNGTSVELPYQLLPGVADGVVVISVGNGRRGLGRVAEQHGFDTYPILPATLETTGWWAGGQIARTGGQVRLANVQADGNSLTPMPAKGYGPKATPSTYAKGGLGENRFEPRMNALEATLAEYAKDPEFPDHLADRIMPDEKVKSWMYPEPPNLQRLPGGATMDDKYLNGVHQWGMSIDLNACVGCNACATACQAENNIVVVGKEQVLMGREMHWIRIDRYFSGEDDVQAIMQPLPCQQCETAPCEAVCPVKATAHSDEGLNDMVYNRCIGTRYCLNNCPFKVRRFNWFNFNLDLHPLEQMQKNPDVTIRFRGVMEKCTYCVQRINRAKIHAKIHGDGRVRDIGPDGNPTIETACQEVCPADAIVFGDLKDPSSAVVKAKNEPRTYQMLRELNMKTRTTYLAKLKNPNPDLV